MNEKSDKKRRVWIILFIIFLIVLAVGVVLFIVQATRRMQAADAYEEIIDSVNVVIDEETDKSGEGSEEEPADPVIEEEIPEEPDILEELGIEIPEKNLDWDALHEENEDIYAWICVPDTTVDYPVLQHPTDNAFYLNHNIDGSSGYPGCIYTEDYNSRDFTDPHTVLYGHNLRDKTMFSTLHNFEDEELFAEDHYIFVYTEDYVYVYQIFAAYEFSAIHLLDNYDLTNEYVYEQYIKDIFNVPNTSSRFNNIRDDIQVTKEDRIITLSTCTSSHNSAFRFLVVGVLLNPL